MKYKITCGVVLAAFLLCLPPRDPVSGCAPAPPHGFGVTIHDEFALITWDPRTKLEHFIRVANFETNAPDIGFLVPTPSVPTLTEVDAAGIARILTWQTRARVVTTTRHVTRFGLGPWPFSQADRAMPTTAAAPVEVLGEYNVAGYEASVLRAEDPAALREWLDQREYETSDALQDWMQVYTGQKWIITALKLSKHGQSSGLTSKGVRMSFQSEQPFYPYREPANDAATPKTGSRMLRVFLLADQRYEGRIGHEHRWARTVWSGDMDHSTLNRLADAAAIEAASIPSRLTEFEDRSFPRLGVDELYFQPASTQATVERPVTTRVFTHEKYFPGWRGAVVAGTIAMPLFVLLATGCWIFWRGKAKSGKQKLSPDDGE